MECATVTETDSSETPKIFLIIYIIFLCNENSRRKAEMAAAIGPHGELDEASRLLTPVAWEV